ncbi:MAG: hypothetical protein AVDCRST_MAG05-2745, partial [uncultured Rubrobacteraceae bacterium]
EHGGDAGGDGGAGDSGAGGGEHARHQILGRGRPDRGLRPSHGRRRLRGGPLRPPRAHGKGDALRGRLRTSRGLHTRRDRGGRRPRRARPDPLPRHRQPAPRRPAHRPHGPLRPGRRGLRRAQGARRGTGTRRRRARGARL